jgi:hypothetical protein
MAFMSNHAALQMGIESSVMNQDGSPGSNDRMLSYLCFSRYTGIHTTHST